METMILMMISSPEEEGQISQGFPKEKAPGLPEKDSQEKINPEPPGSLETQEENS